MEEMRRKNWIWLFLGLDNILYWTTLLQEQEGSRRGDGAEEGTPQAQSYLGNLSSYCTKFVASLTQTSLVDPLSVWPDTQVRPSVVFAVNLTALSRTQNIQRQITVWQRMNWIECGRGWPWQNLRYYPRNLPGVTEETKKKKFQSR
jgi:hypothetical protein